jgi:hypothetical protein
LVRLLEENACHLLRHGSNHDIYQNQKTGTRAPVPRHREIPDSLAKIIFKQLGIEKKEGK